MVHVMGPQNTGHKEKHSVTPTVVAPIKPPGSYTVPNRVSPF